MNNDQRPKGSVAIPVALIGTIVSVVIGFGALTRAYDNKLTRTEAYLEMATSNIKELRTELFDIRSKLQSMEVTLARIERSSAVRSSLSTINPP